jgi:hypothetical protein
VRHYLSFSAKELWRSKFRPSFAEGFPEFQSSDEIETLEKCGKMCLERLIGQMKYLPTAQTKKIKRTISPFSPLLYTCPDFT